MIQPRRILPPLNALRSFEAAGRKLSFRAAAEELGVSQGAVAQQVRALDFLVCKRSPSPRKAVPAVWDWCAKQLRQPEQSTPSRALENNGE